MTFLTISRPVRKGDRVATCKQWKIKYHDVLCDFITLSPFAHIAFQNSLWHGLPVSLYPNRDPNLNVPVGVFSPHLHPNLTTSCVSLTLILTFWLYESSKKVKHCGVIKALWGQKKKINRKRIFTTVSNPLCTNRFWSHKPLQKACRLILPFLKLSIY